jgi:hypothetical protein
VLDRVARGSEVRTDGWQGYFDIGRYRFDHVVTNVSATGDPAQVALPHVHLVASLVKRWILGTHQGAVSHAQLDYYLDEFTFASTVVERGTVGCCSTACSRARWSPNRTPTGLSPANQLYNQAPSGIGGAKWIPSSTDSAQIWRDSGYPAGGMYDETLRRFERTLATAAFKTLSTTIDGERALVGRRSDFRWGWVATRVHTFVVLFEALVNDTDQANGLTDAAVEYSIKHKGGLPRGLQTGTATFATFLTTDPGPELTQVFTGQPDNRSAAIRIPLLADLENDDVVRRAPVARLRVSRPL